jgi:hypothetical protein
LKIRALGVAILLELKTRSFLLSQIVQETTPNKKTSFPFRLSPLENKKKNSTKLLTPFGNAFHPSISLTTAHIYTDKGHLNNK